MHVTATRLAAVIVILTAYAAAAQPAKSPGPCRQIIAACEEAGFVPGGAKTGEGVQVDCVRPIIQGVAQRRKATKPLPQIDPQLVEACKVANPRFGQGNAPAANAPAGGAPPADDMAPDAAPGAAPK